MSPPDSPGSVLPPAWTEVVDRIQKSLDEALAQVAERARVLAEPTTSFKERQALLAQSLAQMNEHARKFEQCVQRAQERTGETEALIAGGVAAAAGWLRTVAACRQRLAREGEFP